MKSVAALISGALFGFGLALSRMIEPAKILAFLDVTGRWDPTLLAVMVGAVVVAAASYRLILRQPRPLLATRFWLPTRTDLDRPLVLGAALFGIGWGLAGYCPGPAIAASALGTWEAPAFVAALIAGSLTYKWLFERSG